MARSFKSEAMGKGEPVEIKDALWWMVCARNVLEYMPKDSVREKKGVVVGTDLGFQELVWMWSLIGGSGTHSCIGMIFPF